MTELPVPLLERGALRAPAPPPRGLPAGPEPGRAAWMLVLCAALWGLSFPMVKALSLLQGGLVPEASSLFLASLLVMLRFGLSALLLLVDPRGFGRPTRLEVGQGLGVGFFGGGALLLQADGLAHTSASTSAFLTQAYCVILPLLVAMRDRRWPHPVIVLGCGLVLAGVAVLSDVDWRSFRIGRGELETLVAAAFCAGQILWIERPVYAGNDVRRFASVGFAVTAAVCLPVALITFPGLEPAVRAYRSGPALGLLVLLVVFCTLGGFMLMNHWQRHVPAVQAGLIYSLEPVFTSAYAMVLPGWISGWAGLLYEN